LVLPLKFLLGRGFNNNVQEELMKKLMGFLLIAGLIFSVAACKKTGGSGNEVTAKEFSWDMAKGAGITILLNQHTAANEIEKYIPDFESLTGIKCSVSILPEDNYYDKLTISLSSGSEPDVFMCGPLMPWELAGEGYIEDLTSYISNPILTNSDYDIGDFFPGVLGMFKWDTKDGHPVGTGPQWSIPMVFEQYVLGYNKRIFAEHNIKVPATTAEMLAAAAALQEFDGPGTYGIALRGTRNWYTCTTSYITNFANYGGIEFAREGSRLVSKVNEPAGVAATQLYVDLIKKGGSPTWSNYTWYECAADLGAGKAAMMFDADLVIYDQNVRDTAEKGNIAFTPCPMPSADATTHSNIWGWGLSMNAASKRKIASWLFVQYFTGKDYMKKAAIEGAVNPSRDSVFYSSEFQNVVAKTEGYLKTFEATIGGTSILSVPQSHFYETTAEWAATLQDIVNGQYPSVKAGLDALKIKMDNIVSDLVIE
jgi:multiple sugar transport system substrate-binding protein